jgi:hypothetical protein
MPFIRWPSVRIMRLGVTSGRWSLQQATEFPVGRKHCKPKLKSHLPASAGWTPQAVAGFPH